MGLAQALQHTLRAVPLAPAVETPQVLPRRLRVLVAEDNATNRLLFEEQLKLLGCQVNTVEDGAQALSALSRGTFDVLVTDLSMPVMDGYALALEARTHWPDLPVIAATASATPDELERCNAAGFTRTVTKPLPLARLRAVLAEVMDLSAAATAQMDCNAQAEGTGELLLGGLVLPDALRQTFSDSIDALLAAISSAQRDNGGQSVLGELHSLRGALGVFRQYALARRCADFENRIRQKGLVSLADVDIAGELRSMLEDERMHA